MLLPEQLSTLNEMGIPVWELRLQATSPADITPVNAEFYEPLPAVDCLMLVADQDDTDEAKRLLHAMLFSIGLTSHNSAIVYPQQLSQLLASTHQHKVLVAFGEQLVPQALSSQATDRGHIYSSSDSALKIIISLSLTSLLTSPNKKALAWQDLQLLKAAYQPTDISQ